MGRAGSCCCGDRAAVRADDPVRGRDRAATGEWIGLEKRDIDRKERVVYVRSFPRGELKFPKTEASMRAVPLQARALGALERIRDGNGSPLLFPGERGGYLDIHHFRPFQWRPAQKAADIDPIRRVYDLRHTFARSLSVPASQPSISLATWAPA